MDLIDRIQPWLAIGIGLLFACVGYYLYHSLLKIYGILFGLVLGFLAVSFINPSPGAWWSLPLLFLLPGLGAVLGYVLAKPFHLVLLFLNCGIAVGLLLSFVSMLVMDHGLLQLLCAIVGFVVGGCLALRYEVGLMTLCTALFGTLLVIYGLDLLGWQALLNQTNAQPTVLGALAYIVLALIGIMIQMRIHKSPGGTRLRGNL